MALTQRNWLNDEAPAIDDTYLNELDDEVRRIANEVAGIEFPLTDSVSITDSTIGASATAVKTAYDEAHKGKSVTAGSALVYSDNILQTRRSTSYGEVKSVYIPFDGTISVSFTLSRVDNMGGTTYGRIYINGVAIGTERSVTSSSVTYTEDFTVANGDKIAIYAKEPAIGTDSNPFYVGISNFKLYGSEYHFLAKDS